MRATVSLDEPRLLREAQTGDLFVPHDARWQECVCARVCDSSGGFAAKPHDAEIVVVACRVDRGEIGHQPTGMVVIASLDTWITFVEPAETPAFREPSRDVDQLMMRDIELQIARL